MNIRSNQSSLFYTTLFLLISIYPQICSKHTYLQLLSHDSEISQLTFQTINHLKNNQTTPINYLLKNYNNDTTTLTTPNSKQPIIEINSHESINFYNPIEINTTSLDIMLEYENSKITMDGEDQFIMINLDDFQGSSMDWSKEKLSTCGGNNMFLGGYCNFGGEEVHKNYTNLPKHDTIRVTANFHFFDKWEGEEAYMYFDGVPVWADSYKWCDKVFLWYCKKFGINVCGTELPDRLSVPIDFSSKCSVFIIFIQNMKYNI